jgi:hypothetical protein
LKKSGAKNFYDFPLGAVAVLTPMNRHKNCFNRFLCWFGGAQASEPQAESSKSLFGSFSSEKEPL